jgi:tRNA nucleotidyltransferase (CCA-adding enzyme)
MEEIAVTPENQEYMKLAALFHDVGKPDTYFMDEEGIGHFYGHPARGEEVVHDILVRLKADKFMLDRISLLVKRHDLIFKRDEVLLKKWMNKLSPEVMFELLEIKRADNMATGNMHQKLKDKFEDIRIMMERILEEEQCFSLKDMAVDGRDIMGLGVKPGPEVGRVLGELLDAVIEGRCENQHDGLMALAAEKVLQPE